MYKDVLRDIDGISIYPVISLIVFALFFVFLTVSVVKMKKGYITDMKNLPLDESVDNLVLENKETKNVQSV